jgi:hypothetical protein
MGKKNKGSGTEINLNNGKGEESKNANPEKSEFGLEEIESMFSEKKRQAKRENIESESKKKKRKSESAPSKRQSNKSMVEEKLSRGSSSKWVDDGLGGRFNAEGFTGRVEEGMKVFKAHVLNKPNFGSTKNCPFDCDCCFI